jgi:hypothetical protein
MIPTTMSPQPRIAFGKSHQSSAKSATLAAPQFSGKSKKADQQPELQKHEPQLSPKTKVGIGIAAIVGSLASIWGINHSIANADTHYQQELLASHTALPRLAGTALTDTDRSVLSQLLQERLGGKDPQEAAQQLEEDLARSENPTLQKLHQQAQKLVQDLDNNAERMQFVETVDKSQLREQGITFILDVEDAVKQGNAASGKPVDEKAFSQWKQGTESAFEKFFRDPSNENLRDFQNLLVIGLLLVTGVTLWNGAKVAVQHRKAQQQSE